jgi:hypothetical protein
LAGPFERLVLPQLLFSTEIHLSPQTKERLVDQEAIKNAEAQIANVQSALDDAQRVLKAAERAQETAEKSAEVMRTVALAAVGGLVLVTLVVALHRRHH